MSNNPILPEDDLSGNPPVAAQPMPEEKEPVEEVIVPKATFRENHTAENTPFADYVKPELFISKIYTPEEAKALIPEGYVSYFLGHTKKVMQESNEVVTNWVEYNTAELAFNDGDIDISALNAIKNKWQEFVAEKYPGKTEEEIFDYCRKLYAFNSELLDSIRVRSKILNEENTSNVSDRGGLVTPDIFGKRLRNTVAGDLVERMRRQSIGAKDEEYNFDVLLRNSFVHLTLRRPSRLRLGELIQEVHRTVKGYVRSTNNPTINLSYLAAVRAVWRYILSLIVSCSVKDISDFKQLEDVILISDIEALVVGLSKAAMNKGHNVQLHCLETGCGWVGLGLADPSKLLQKRDRLITKTEAALYANLMNGRAKLSVAEIREYQGKSAYLENNRVYNEDRTYYLEIEPPTLSIGFEALDQVADSINPRIQKLRADSPTEDEFEVNLENLLIDVSPMEYIHWVARTCTPGVSEDDDDVIERKGSMQSDFNAGIMVVLEDDVVLANRLATKVKTITPFMSRTYCGVGYFECPDCRKNSKEGDTIGLGYTPINPLMNFFTLTQLTTIQNMRKLIKEEEVL